MFSFKPKPKTSSPSFPALDPKVAFGIEAMSSMRLPASERHRSLQNATIWATERVELWEMALNNDRTALWDLLMNATLQQIDVFDKMDAVRFRFGLPEVASREDVYNWASDNAEQMKDHSPEWTEFHRLHQLRLMVE